MLAHIYPVFGYTFDHIEALGLAGVLCLFVYVITETKSRGMRIYLVLLSLIGLLLVMYACNPATAKPMRNGIIFRAAACPGEWTEHGWTEMVQLLPKDDPRWSEPGDYIVMRLWEESGRMSIGGWLWWWDYPAHLKGKIVAESALKFRLDEVFEKGCPDG